ncbi:hypothetical protein NE237_028146 [Protea cynaroides]|uniref:Acyl-[acyl-carrier-protein] hydrolase n=1 Tax=Protea cynaroides TaxID=273540 RepID=A0A9Q0GPU6_9MAGN|nr:hypothetical protein NE237_028146 [Protea cynaroides]
MAVPATFSSPYFFLTIPAPPSSSSANRQMKLGIFGNKCKFTVTSTILPVFKVYARAGVPSKIDEHAVVDQKSPVETQKNRDWAKFLHQLPGSTSLFGAIQKAAEKQLKLVDPFPFGEIVDGGPIFCQNYNIRSYDLGPNRTASMQTLTNFIQETSLNHLRIRGLLSDGFGSTPEMAKRNLIWVITKFHVVVDRYPSWGETVELDSWVGTNGKNSAHTNCIFRNCKTGEILARSSSLSVMMNKKTRKLSKFPEEFREETKSFVLQCDPLLDENSMKLSKFDEKNMDHVRTGLSPIWNDLDVNQHVSHIKYTGWMLQSVPESILKSLELGAITLEFRRECGLDSVLQSSTSVVDGATDDGSCGADGFKCAHVLRLESGAVVAKGWTQWRPSYANNTPASGECKK